ncbi:sulfurtransferase [Acetobacter senegalensis]|nr:sulfurtransferase [Acetobacter senegalensis]
MFPLLSVKELYETLPTGELRIFDATALLPGDTFNPYARFEQAHIPGSRYFDGDEFSDPESTQPHTVPTPARFGKLFGHLGVKNTDRVVFYDQGNIASACRAWWLARLFGHEFAYVLDGGLPEWQRHDLPVEQGPAKPVSAETYQPRPHYERLKGLGDMLEYVQTDTPRILDARSADRFYGHVPEPRPGLASGHMPGALNIPFKRMLDDKGCFLPPQTLRQIFLEAGIPEDQAAVTTCGSGMTASVLNVGLCRAGFPDSALYDGSWAEWGATPDAPVTKDA